MATRKAVVARTPGAKHLSTRLKTRLETSAERPSKPKNEDDKKTTRKPSVARTTKRPSTPPSSRVTKTRFFPTKKTYSKKQPEEPERPRTATLRRGSIVNHNFVGPDAPPKQPPRPPSPEYEDDFDSYESDFEPESCSSTSETDSNEAGGSGKQRHPSAGTDDEKKLDSGNYELPEPRHKQILDNIKESIEKENANLSRVQLGSLSDEGFEDGRSSLQFINFLGAQRKDQRRKSMVKRRKRGEEIMSMIQLDTFSFTLLDSPSVPYDDFIRTFGKSNSLQASNQTGDEDINEETQTEDVSIANKWVQFPAVIEPLPPECDNYEAICKRNYLGVGGDDLGKVEVQAHRLECFMLSAGDLMLQFLEEKDFRVENEAGQKSSVPFSKSVVFCNTQKLDFLKNRRIVRLDVSSSDPDQFLTVHNQDKASNISLVCIWNITNLSKPRKVFKSFGDLSCAIFGLDCHDLIFGGLKNGMVTVWDVSKRQETPSFCTEIGQAHHSSIVSIKSLAEPVPETSKKPAEICTLDEDGDIAFWSVLFFQQSYLLVKNSTISLGQLYPELLDFKCTALGLNRLDLSHLFVSTNYGIILHCLAGKGRPTIKKFNPDEAATQANCLAVCPFSAGYFLAGFSNGETGLYSRLVERPLMLFSVSGADCGTESVQWSCTRPLIFYTKDEANTVHVWNLKVSDMFPTHSIPFKDRVAEIQLSGRHETTYMIVVTGKGFYIHFLDQEHGIQPLGQLENEQKIFLNYIAKFG